MNRIPKRYPPQVNDTTCGVASLAVFCARADEHNGGELADYAAYSAEEVASIQRRLHQEASWTGLPWPRFLGTSPWAIARLARRKTGKPHRIRLWTCTQVARARKARAQGNDVFIFVGGRLLPRHVVLMLGAEDSGSDHSGKVQIFEPGTGIVHEVECPDGWVPWRGKAPKAHWGWWTRPLLIVYPKE